MSKRRFFTAAILCILTAGIAAACTPENPQDNAPPPIIDSPSQSDASNWVEASAPITLDNVPRIAALGQLDQPDEITTIFTYALSPDATVLVGLNNAETLAWDLIDGSLMFTTSRADASRAYFSSDKTAVFILSSDGTLRALSSDTGGEMFNFAVHPTYNETTAFDPEMDRLAVGGMDGTVKIWDLFGRESLVTIDVGDTAITALAFSLDGTRVAAANETGDVSVWEWETLTEIDRVRNVLINVDGSTTPLVPLQLRFHPTGEHLAIATDRDTRLWHIGMENAVVRISVTEGLSPVLLFSPDGSFVVSGTTDAGLALWDGETGAPVIRLFDTTGRRISADFSPDGRMLVTSIFDGSVTLWNLSDVREQSIGTSRIPINSRSIFDVEWTDDGRLILIFDGNGAVYAWGIPPS